MKSLLALAGMLSGMLTGCGFSNPIDTTPVKVRIVSINPASGGWDGMQAHTVVERMDTLERVSIQHTTWGKTGDVFAIKAYKLHW